VLGAISGIRVHLLGESGAALTTLHQAIALSPELDYIRLFLATAYDRMEHDKEARESIVEDLRVRRDLMAGKSESVVIVMKAQLELAARGYYLGTVGGSIGPFIYQPSCPRHISARPSNYGDR
jgi:hypothetical protein